MKKYITGSGGGKGGGGGGGRVATEAPDSLRSTAFARVLDLISEGEIDGLVDGLKSVYLDGTPIQNQDGSFNFTGVTVATVPGTQSQSPIPGFPDVEAEVGVGVEVTASVSVTKTITNADRDAARVRLSFPGLSSQNTSNGDISGTSVQIAIDLQANGGGFVAQLLSKSWSPSGTTATVASTGISPTVTWTPSGATDPETGLVLYPTITFQVQYRVVGAGSWTTFLTDSFTPPDGRLVEEGDTPPPSRTYVIDGLASALYQVQVVKTSGDGTVAITQTSIYTPTAFDTITGKTTSTYQRSYRIALTGSPPWDIRVRRITPDSTTVALRNKTVWDSYTEITEEQLIYPMSALAGIIIDASQFSAIPVRGYQIKGIKVRIPSNYNPVTRVYTGTWDGTFTTAWTNNPAWCFYELLTNTRWGLGKYLDAAQVDKAALYTIGKHCDGMVPDGLGGQEPRFQCSLYLQTQEEAFQSVVALASIFRGMAYWAAGAVTPVQDSPADAVFLFNESNVEGGLFTYSGSARNARHTVALVSWNDPADGFKRKPEYVDDTAGILRYGVNQVEITAVGCTSRGQAHRLGSWLLYSEQSETELVVFRAGLDGIYLRPGAIFQVQDQHRAGIRFGGRITAAAAGSVTVDKAITIEAGKTYTIQVVLPDGTLATKTLTNAPGTTAVLTVSVNFATVPVKPAVWIVTASDLSPRSYRALQIVEADKNKFEVTGVAHNPGKFALIEQGLKLTTPRTSTISVIPANPVNLILGEYLLTLNTKVIAVLSASWEPVASATGYVVSYRKDQGNFISLPDTSAPHIEVQDVLPGTYEVQVQARNSIGRLSVPTNGSRMVLGLGTAPANVTNLSDFFTDGVTYLTWDAVAWVLPLEYEIRVGAAWQSAIVLGRTPNNRVAAAGNGTYWVAARTVSQGVYSVTPASVVIDGAILTQNVQAILDEDGLGWPGTVSGDVAVVLPDIRLVGTGLWDAIPDVDGMTDLVDYYGGLGTSGYYEIPSAHIVDLGVSKECKISATYTAHGEDLTNPNLVDTVPDVDAWADVDGFVSDFVVVDVEIATAPDSGTFGAWRKFVPGTYFARKFKFRLRIASSSPTVTTVVTTFDITVDMPDRVEVYTNQAIAPGGTAITFTPPFQITPSIQVTILGATEGDQEILTAAGVGGVTVQVKNGGAGQSRNVNVTAQAH